MRRRKLLFPLSETLPELVLYESGYLVNYDGTFETNIRYDCYSIKLDPGDYVIEWDESYLTANTTGRVVSYASDNDYNTNTGTLLINTGGRTAHREMPFTVISGHEYLIVSLRNTTSNILLSKQ